jgi:LacI family transcriptional regulator
MRRTRRTVDVAVRGEDAYMGPGESITIRDVARVAGVSVGTVSRVLNDKATVQPDMRARVQKAIADLGYEPNAVAQSMRRRLTHTVGCVIREINIPALAAFVRAAHDVLDEAGFSLLLSNSEARRDRERELLTRLSRRQADGILMGPYSPIDRDFEAFLRKLGLPLVLVDRDLPVWADCVMADHRSGIRMATEHLLGLGHRRIALLTGEPSLYPAKSRLIGYEEAFARHGVPLIPTLARPESFLAANAFRTVSAMLASKDPPTAIIAGGIDMLPGVLRAIRVRGLEIPRDISVVGAGDSELSELHTPSISVQRWDQAETGRIAAGLLLDRIFERAGPEPRHVLLPTEFVRRDSTGPVPKA